VAKTLLEGVFVCLLSVIGRESPRTKQCHRRRLVIFSVDVDVIRCCLVSSIAGRVADATTVTVSSVIMTAATIVVIAVIATEAPMAPSSSSLRLQ
jgi:hypothetical protein